METPVRNMVELVDLSPNDSLLPIIECVSNSIISLSQSHLAVKERKIDVEIIRGKSLPQLKMFGGETRPIKDVIVTDNGVGFNDQNFRSFNYATLECLKEKLRMLRRWAVLCLSGV